MNVYMFVLWCFSVFWKLHMLLWYKKKASNVYMMSEQRHFFFYMFITCIFRQCSADNAALILVYSSTSANFSWKVSPLWRFLFMRHDVGVVCNSSFLLKYLGFFYRRWNATFMDYSSHVATDVTDYSMYRPTAHSLIHTFLSYMDRNFSYYLSRILYFN